MKGGIFSLTYFTDLHAFDRDITTRNDSSSRTALNKLRFIIKTAQKDSLLVSGGDLFSDRVDSQEYLAELVTICQGHDNFVSVIGNHDVVHRTYDGFRRRNIAVLKAANCIEILRTQHLDAYGILGYSAYDEQVISELSPEQRLRVRALFAHHSIQYGTDRLVLRVAEVKQLLPNLKYIFSGHDHTQYPTVEIEGVSIVRPGSVLRTTTALENVTRAPAIARVSFDQDWDNVKVEFVTVPHAPAAEVFNLDTKAVNKSVEAQLEDFVQTLASSASSDTTESSSDLEAYILARAQAVGDPDLYDYIRQDLPALMS
jgi:2',3'-cyclic-nucleotide 2'-phosphodiesterase (5'-nucleotidase family)